MQKISAPEGITLKGRIKLFTRKSGLSDPWMLRSVTDNLIMTSQNLGRDLLVQWLLGLTAYTGGIAWGAIGTSDTAVTSSDSKLGAETNRTTPSFTQDFQFNTAQIQFYFTDAQLANETYYEFGTFVGGTSSPNSGQMFNHALFTEPFIKVAGEDLTVEVDIALN